MSWRFDKNVINGLSRGSPLIFLENPYAFKNSSINFLLRWGESPLWLRSLFFRSAKWPSMALVVLGMSNVGLSYHVKSQGRLVLSSCKHSSVCGGYNGFCLWWHLCSARWGTFPTWCASWPSPLQNFLCPSWPTRERVPLAPWLPAAWVYAWGSVWWWPLGGTGTFAWGWPGTVRAVLSCHRTQWLWCQTRAPAVKKSPLHKGCSFHAWHIACRGSCHCGHLWKASRQRPFQNRSCPWAGQSHISLLLAAQPLLCRAFVVPSWWNNHTVNLIAYRSACPLYILAKAGRCWSAHPLRIVCRKRSIYTTGHLWPYHFSWWSVTHSKSSFFIHDLSFDHKVWLSKTYNGFSLINVH